MAGIQTLIDTATREPEPPPLPPEIAAKPSRSISELIEAERNKPLDSVPFDMSFGDVLAPVVIIQIRGQQWAERTRTAIRPGDKTDYKLRCNSDELVEQWPLESVTIAGDHPTREQWIQVWRLIDAPERADIVSALYWLHWGKPMEELERARQASAKKGATNG